MLKPGDMLLGVLNFLAILVPGFVAIALIGLAKPNWVEPFISSIATLTTVREVAYAIAAYFVGQIAFLLGSILDPVYGSVRKILSPADNTKAYDCVEKIRNSYLKLDAERAAVNPYQWSKAILMAAAPTAADDINRFEADSKFFRSLAVVSVAVAATQVCPQSEGYLLSALIGALACFGGFYYWRTKCTTRAYLHIIALQRAGRLSKSEDVDA